jgi:hypothetical protein
MYLNIECLLFDYAKMRTQKANSISSTCCVCVLVGLIVRGRTLLVLLLLLLLRLLLSQVALVFHFKGTPEARLLSRLKHICKAEAAAAARAKADSNASGSRWGRAAHNQIVPEGFQAGGLLFEQHEGQGQQQALIFSSNPNPISLPPQWQQRGELG